jgi:hypothetical protein
MPAWVSSGATIFAVLSLFPVVTIAALRIDEAGSLALLARMLRPFPDRLR